MPAPQASMMSQLARLKFTSFALKVPQNWSDPQGDPDGQQYKDSFKDSEKSVMPGMPPLFQPATMNKYHVDSQKMHIAKIGKFIDDTMSAIASAWSQWQTSASMVGITVMGPMALGGQIVAPPFIINGPQSTASEAKYSKVIAAVIGKGWDTFTKTVTSPGLPWYPAFAAATAPVAIPMTNVPGPPSLFAALIQVPVTISMAVMKPLMIAQLGDPQAPFHKELFESIADAFEKTYDLWKVTTMVTKAMGTGPVPTMATPVPVPGPVVGGIATMPPGGFA
jgi:hypothetical protein